MNRLSKVYTEDEYGFNGNCEAYLIQNREKKFI